jgi:hypothetical protein
MADCHSKWLMNDASAFYPDDGSRRMRGTPSDEKKPSTREGVRY